jgi:hypothetical protein
MSIYIGIDWSQDKHDVAFLIPAGQALTQHRHPIAWLEKSEKRPAPQLETRQRLCHQFREWKVITPYPL